MWSRTSSPNRVKSAVQYVSLLLTKRCQTFAPVLFKVFFKLNMWLCEETRLDASGTTVKVKDGVAPISTFIGSSDCTSGSTNFSGMTKLDLHVSGMRLMHLQFHGQLYAFNLSMTMD